MKYYTHNTLPIMLLGGWCEEKTTLQDVGAQRLHWPVAKRDALKGGNSNALAFKGK